MPIVHIVLFEFKPSTELDVIHEACNRMLTLKTNCIHPTTKTPYIVSTTGGRDNSPEGHQVGGFTHAFVVNFANAEDRDYYVHQDPAHKEVVMSVGALMQNIRVVDYEPGTF